MEKETEVISKKKRREMNRLKGKATSRGMGSSNNVKQSSEISADSIVETKNNTNDSNAIEDDAINPEKKKRF